MEETKRLSEISQVDEVDAAPAYPTMVAPPSKSRAIIFWDIENLSIKRAQSFAFIKSLEKKYGMCTILAMGSMTNVCAPMQDELYSLGVDLLLIPRGHSSPKESTDRAIGRKMSEVEKPTTLVIITSDGDFAHDIAKARQRGHRVELIHGKNPSRMLVRGLCDRRYNIAEFLSPKSSPPPPPAKPIQCDQRNDLIISDRAKLGHQRDTTHWSPPLSVRASKGGILFLVAKK